MNQNYLFIILLFLSIDFSQASEEETNEGHLSHVGFEEKRVNEESRRLILGTEKNKIWSNCFADSDKEEKNTNLEDTYEQQLFRVVQS